MAENVIIGLIGELIILRQLVLSRSEHPASMMRALDCWQGWQDGGRDFRIGEHVIEVKTTRSVMSIHEFSGLRQLEAKVLPTGNVEQLHLMSIGLSQSNTMGESLPSIVGSIVALMAKAGASSEVTDEFLRRVALYGSQLSGGYVHATMQDWNVYGTRYAHTYLPRLYRIDDPAMRLLDRNMLAKTFVQAEGLSFSMHFPEQVSAFNPAQNWEEELHAMVAAS